AVELHNVPFPSQLVGALRRERLPDELRRLQQRRVVRTHLHLRDQRDDLASRSRTTQRVLDRLLDHVADPAGRSRDEHPEWKRARLGPRDLVADELVTDLWAIAMDHADVPPV